MAARLPYLVYWTALIFFGVGLSVRAQTPVLQREVPARSISLFVGDEPDPPRRELTARSISLFVGAETDPPHRETTARSISLVVDAPGAPAPVTQLVATPSPTGASTTLDWEAYNEFAEGDIAGFDIYMSTVPFYDITGLTRYATVPAETRTVTFDGLAPWQDRYYAVVAVDAAGNFDPSVTYAGAIVLQPEVVPRSLTLFVGAEPNPPYRETTARSISLVVSTPEPPARITQLSATPSPTGNTTTLNWNGYNEWAENDVVRYDIYQETVPFLDVTGLTPVASVTAESFSHTFTGLAPWTDRYYAVVAVDALGNFDSAVDYTAAVILQPEVIVRSLSLFVGAEPDPPDREVTARSISLLVPDLDAPSPVTYPGSPFDAVTSSQDFGAIEANWSFYNEWSQNDVVRYRIYINSGYFTDVTEMTPYQFVPGEQRQALIEGFGNYEIVYVAVVAEDALGNFEPIVHARSAQASYVPVFGFGGTTEVVKEGQMADILVTLEGTASSATYQIFPFSAVPFDGTTGDYLDVVEPLEFEFNTFLNRNEAHIRIPIIRDEVMEGEEGFFVRILNSSGGVASSVVVTITEDVPRHTAVWHPERQEAPATAALASNQLAVDLDPSVSGAQWRLVGEPFWRDPGPANLVGPLSRGRHRVEYKSVSGFGQPVFPINDPNTILDDGPDPRTYDFLGQGETYTFQTTYPVDATAPTGSLLVTLKPDSLATAPLEADRSQWRLLGETTWRESGTTTALPVGKHLIEFKDAITGHLAPTPRAVTIADGVQSWISAVYRTTPATGTAPTPLPFTATSGDPQVDAAPYHFVGQIETAQGYGSGVAATQRTVLTAGRVVWDPNRLASAEDITWHNQRHADYGQDTNDHHIPEVQYPRGYVLIAGYEAMRTTESATATGEEVPGDHPSDQLDLAVLYFTSENGESTTARGGFSGFLADYNDNPTTNPWLLGAADKLLAGYPLSGIPDADRGLMHATAPGSSGLTNFDGFLYRSTEFSGTPGLEGAPLFVRHGNGNSYPAAVYLGQNNGAVFRSLDSYAAFAIWLAEAFSRSGFPRDNSGGEYDPQWSEDDDLNGFLYVDFIPAHGRWRIVDIDDPERATEWFDPGLRVPVREGDYTIEYEPVAGFTTPVARTVSTVAGLTSAPVVESYLITYDDWAALHFTTIELNDPLVSGSDVTLNGLPNLLAYACGLAPGQATRPIAEPATITPGLPRFSINAAAPSPIVTVEFLARNPELAPDLRYIIEFAPSPEGPWTPSTDPPYNTAPTLAPLDDTWSLAILQVTPPDTNGMHYARVRVELVSEP